MAGSNTTLRLALTQKKPPILCNERSMKNTHSNNWPAIDLEVWSEFKLVNLDNEYGSLLNKHVPEHDLVFPRADQNLHGITINGLDDIKRIIAWNDLLMRPTLDIAKSAFAHIEGDAISHAYTPVDKSTIAKVEGPNRKVFVDHVITLQADPWRNLVVGLGKPSSRFNMGGIHSANARISEHGYVLRHLAHLCTSANTPYGYIQTDRELVACQFKRNGDRYKVYYMQIQWSTHGPERLTTDLALWWLCMKALSPAVLQIEDITPHPNDPTIWMDEFLGNPGEPSVPYY
ncbi:hypothetical protein F4821DRAFT_279414 [Hypoxylon rubiginosum]|uniref:Uncharacterized protein n=1 Tax=Hypoxylon rubiginosum TaxID=110542 RepID=A0ACC0CXM8_9PEZI|nr:hypothetical protein F4821DRAFT_279414 [Hypoxylon rubiginosum]